MRKSVAPFNYIYHDTFDVDGIRQKIEDVKDDVLITFNNYWNVGDKYEIIVNDEYKPFLDYIEPILTKLEITHGGRIGMVKKVKVNNYGQIKPKMDKGDYADIARRHIIPIITNDKVIHTVGGESMNIPTGTCLEINNMRVHQLNNNSTEDHTHLQIDILPNVWFD